ncbi:DUF6474 family protein [Gordonia zhaorongruii]|uniref:DUF6474 family protein n=1 Tax=Gordonia zhaorongruii TaxID=2597659 RepID=UPI00104CE3F4|nr:DUF6474 family protein [Gordonia zhaorongruii]
MGVLSFANAKLNGRKAEKKIRKAEHKAIKVSAKAKAKAESAQEQKVRKKELRAAEKRDKAANKTSRKNAKASAKAQQKVAEADAKAAAEQTKQAAEAAMFTPAKMKRYLTVGRMVAPVAVPIAYRGAVAARAQFTEVKAKRAGVPASVLNQYGGPSASLRARIATARNSAARVGDAEQTGEGRAFVDAMSSRLDNLQIAADAADTMPPSQRKSAQRAIDNELSAIDNDLLARLNVHPDGN